MMTWTAWCIILIAVSSIPRSVTRSGLRKRRQFVRWADKGDSYDNAAAESLNSLYKRELIDFEKGWEGVGDVMMATMEWVSWYNVLV